MCIENQSHPFVSHRTLSHRRLSSSSPPPVGRSLADRIADRPIAIPLDPTRDARSTSHAFRDAPDAAPARRYRHKNISPHSSPTSVGVDVAAPSTASAFPSSCPPTRERETVLPTTSHDSINHRGTRVWSPASVARVRIRVSFALACRSRRTRFGPEELFMTTSPRFFAATRTVFAETRLVDVRACIIIFRKFRVRVYAVATDATERHPRDGPGRAPVTRSRDSRFVTRRFYPEARDRPIDRPTDRESRDRDYRDLRVCKQYAR